MLYCSWHMARDRYDCYFSFWAIFCPFTPIIAQKIKISKKLKKIPGDIIILNKCTKNHDNLLYCSWDMACDRCNCFFFFILGYFLPFYPCNSLKNENFKKIKKLLEISLFHICVPKIMIRWCTVPEISCTTDEQMERVTYWGGCPT